MACRRVEGPTNNENKLNSEIRASDRKNSELHQRPQKPISLEHVYHGRRITGSQYPLFQQYVIRDGIYRLEPDSREQYRVLGPQHPHM